MSYLFRLLLLGVIALFPAFAHDIPTDATVQVYAIPTGNRLQLAIRVPLRTMRDVQFPERPGSEGYLDIDTLWPQLANPATQWLAQYIDLYEEGTALGQPSLKAVQLSFPSDRSFDSFENAVRHITGPRLPGNADLSWSNASFDVLFEVPIGSETSRFSIEPRLAHLAARVVTILRFRDNGAPRILEFNGNPGRVPLNPDPLDSAWRFLRLGFAHILDGTDHLLFLLCLALPCRRPKELLLVVTAFTAAHSLTLIASACGLAPDALWFPPFIEMLIAVSIVWMSIENIAERSAGTRRWIVAFAFGLIHGFGFSFALRETLQFAGNNLITALLSFNVGVEIGQIAVLLLMVPVILLVFRYVLPRRLGTIILSTLVAHTAWHWMLERYGDLRKYNIEIPPPSLVTVGWLMLGVGVAVVLGLAGKRLTVPGSAGSVGIRPGASN